MVFVKFWFIGVYVGIYVCLIMIKIWFVVKLFWEIRLDWYYMFVFKFDVCVYIIFNFLGFFIFLGY